jgi:hypothetical protein
MAQFAEIKVQLQVKNGNVWNDHGAAMQATPAGGNWSSPRYNNLPAGTYRVKVVFKYHQMNPVPGGANPQSVEGLKEFPPMP